ncbi:hypothetical protein ACFLVJ_01825 [Chloroflexota bacterium]
MARKATVDKDVILSLLKEGETTQRIGEKFHVSRQAIDLHRKDFIEKGLLPNLRALRMKKEPKRTAPQAKNDISTRESPTSKDIASLDGHIDLMINAFTALKRLPQLEKEVETYKQEYEKALQVIERLKENEKKRLDQESRWLLTWRNNDKEQD